jgi:protein SCO1/2
MRRLQNALPSEIHLVSITVDPARDTPAVLAGYAKNYGADTARWHFLTGEKDAIYRLSIEGFKLGVDDTMGDEAEPIVHSTRFVLVDQEGRIRGFYHGLEDPDLEKLAVDARSLL